MKYKKKDLIKAIEDYEFYSNGLNKLNGVSVVADNISIDDDGRDEGESEDTLITADITIYYDADNRSESYGEVSPCEARLCEYPLSMLISGGWLE